MAFLKRQSFGVIYNVCGRGGGGRKPGQEAQQSYSSTSDETRKEWVMCC